MQTMTAREAVRLAGEFHSPLKATVVYDTPLPVPEPNQPAGLRITDTSTTDSWGFSDQLALLYDPVEVLAFLAGRRERGC